MQFLFKKLIVKLIRLTKNIKSFICKILNVKHSKFITLFKYKNSLNLTFLSNNNEYIHNDDIDKGEEINFIENEIEVNSITEMNNINLTMMQYFEWYLEPNCSLWKSLKDEMPKLSEMGITSLWLPPAYKGANGKNDVGYGVYDLYDLGEFNQKGSVETKYGTKDDYIKVIELAHKNNIDVYGDIVFSHKGGADKVEKVKAIRVDNCDRNKQIGEPLIIDAWTKFIFEKRFGKYSKFKWNFKHFNAVDFDNSTKENSIFKFCESGSNWSEEVDNENGNFEYLMYADINMSNKEVVEELKKWGSWYVATTKVNGFRLDAVKHIQFSFYKEWLSFIRNKYKKISLLWENIGVVM